MDFRIADTFTDSLVRLTGEEQKAAKTTAFDLQVDPANPGHSFHKLDKARDKNFWSVRVSRDIRIIVHKTPGSLLLCYVDHHDRAYDWAERRKLETHPTTGAAQLVQIRETVQDIVVPRYSEAPVHAAAPVTLFAHIAQEELLSYGVPQEWLADVSAATEESLLNLAEHLPAEAAEALLELATGGKPAARVAAKAETNPFEHPDAIRRFRVMSNVDELQRALEFPWDKWTVFLHPDQRQVVEREYTGPARVSGSAGTGKTIVALHRAAHLARRHPDSRVLLTTFSEPLANALLSRLKKLVYSEPKLIERIDVHSLDAIAVRLHRAHVGVPRIATRAEVVAALKTALGTVEGQKFALPFVASEWDQVIDAWQIRSWETYRDIVRLGRKTRLPEAQRNALWIVFERAMADLRQQGLITMGGVYAALVDVLPNSKNPPFDFVVVDEAQDLGIQQLRFLAAMGGQRPDALFFAGDLGQRIFQQPFSWKALGVDIRGRSRTLKVNYRTSHQIRKQADRLLGEQVSDVDGNLEDRGHTVSVFNGPSPTIQILDSNAAECTLVGGWLKAQVESGVAAHEIGLFVRSDAELSRARAAADAAGLPYRVLDAEMSLTSDRATLSTMHLAKGLEFRVVAVMACDDEIVPLQSRIETVGEESDLQEVYETERHLLYVACTRARDALLVTGVAPGSEFLEDMVESK